MKLLYLVSFLSYPYAVWSAQPAVDLYNRGGLLRQNYQPPPGQTPIATFRQLNFCRTDLFLPQRTHHGAIFSSISNNHQYKALANCVQRANYNPGMPKNFSNKEFSDRIKSINEDDVAKCNTKYSCKFLIRFIYGIPKKSLQGLNPICVQRFVETVIRQNPMLPPNPNPDLPIKSAFKLLPDSVIAENAGLIARLLGGRIVDVGEDTLRKIIKTTFACSNITRAGWNRILHTVQSNALLTPECVNQGRDLIWRIQIRHDAKFSKMPQNVFERYNNPLHGAGSFNLSADQLANFASMREMGQLPGKYLDLPAIPSSVSRGLTLRLILGYLYHNEARALVMDDDSRAWSNVSEDIFRDLSGDDVERLSRALNGSQLQNKLKSKQVTDLLKFPQLATVMNPTAASRATEISVSSFLSLPPASQAAVLVASKAPLPDDILTSITGTVAEGWVYDDKTGLKVLCNLKRANKDKIISNLGKVYYDNPARLVDSVDYLKDIKPLQEHMNAQFFANMSVKLEEEDMKGLNARLRYLMPFSELKKTMSKEAWGKLSADELRHIISGGAFCQHATLDIMQLINRKAYASFTKQCYRQLRMINSLSKDVIQAFPPAVFTAETKESINGSVIAMLTPEQLEALGSEITDAQNPSSNFTLEILNGFSKEHLAKVTANQWRHTPDPSFATISSTERLAAIPGGATTYWSIGKVRQMAVEVLIHLNKAQAENIGKSCEGKDSPLSYLNEQKFTDEQVQKLIQERASAVQETQGATEEGLSKMTIILIVVGAAVLVGVIGFVIYKFWWSGA